MECLVGSAAPFSLETAGSSPGRETQIVEEEQLAWRKLKAGQRAQLAAGRRAASALATQGVHPHFVQQAHAAADTLEAIGRPTSLKPVLFEWCCEPDSRLSRQWEKEGGAAVRLGLPQFDLSSAEVVRSATARLRVLLDRGRPMRVHAAFPCTAWCAWHRMGL